MLFAAGPAQAQQRSQCLAAHADAQMLRMKGALLAAREQLLVCGQPKCPGPIANDCASWLSEVDGSLSSVVFAVSDEQGQDMPDVHVSAGGKLLAEHTDGRALVLDPGTYVFSFEAPGYTNVETTVSMRQSEKNRIVRLRMLRPPPEPKPVALVVTPASEPAQPSAPVQATEPASGAGGVPIATYILGGTALLGVGTFAYFGLSGNAKKKEVEQCTSNCEELINEGKRDYVIADIGLLVAIASAPAAILIYLLAPPERAESAHAASHARLQPYALSRGAGMLLSGEF
jgi:hypothetical protein